MEAQCSTLTETAVFTRNIADYPPSRVRAIPQENALAEVETYLRHPIVRRRRRRKGN